MFDSTHYQWLGEAPDTVQGPLVQGKLTNAINNYCINIQGNWELCGSCHAGRGIKPGKGAEIDNADPNFDVHMNVLGPDLSCQNCHAFQGHRVIGKGSDLRPTDDLGRGSGVSCQSCHIPTYAKWETETHREWEIHHDGSSAHGSNTTPGHPHSERATNLTPVLKFWNRLSVNALLREVAVTNPETGHYPTSLPLGDIADGMLTPFKYKTAQHLDGVIYHSTLSHPHRPRCK